jgi:hypothetical protein
MSAATAQMSLNEMSSSKGKRKKKVHVSGN